MEKSNNISVTFIICVLIINISAIFVLLFTSFGVAIGVTTRTINMTLNDVKDMYTRAIVILVVFLIMNTTLFYFYKRSKNGLTNPFIKKKTIGELVKKESRWRNCSVKERNKL